YYWLVAAEGAAPSSLPGISGQLFITAERARSLGLDVNSGLAALKLPPRSDTLESLINPLKLAQSEILADFDAKEVNADHPANEAMDLVRLAGTLPALIMGPQIGRPPVDAMIYETSPCEKIHLTKISDVNMPLRAAPNARATTYRDNLGATHMAIIVGKPDFSRPPVVRVHSSCLTGDILGSLRCDCGDQLQAALTALSEGEGGILLYLDQEGRGIGLANKLRAYELQDRGMDTYAANHALGFSDDERNMDAAAAMLREMDIHAVRLLSNNPHKVKMLADAGIIVKERLPLEITANPHNTAYLSAKAGKGGHVMVGNITEKKPKKI
ncbi:MAG TPA: GTP cyclohydrolase II, partial [Alphaproteobacteria bacterium]|nr:GTP cyclohydrolase II [Alphaproteobacteria bacterium]